MTNFILFADDTTLAGSNQDVKKLINEITQAENEINIWFLSNKLCRNESKTQRLYFSLRELDTVEETIKDSIGQKPSIDFILGLRNFVNQFLYILITFR
mgnify:CR=1 FL=1